MLSKATTVNQYIEELPIDRKAAFSTLRNEILKNLPDGYKESLGYGMVQYCVPLSVYPAGYHCNPEMPLGLMSLANQKNFIAVYHMGIFSDEKLLKWFVDTYTKNVTGKLDMGKACIRFKKIDNIPFKLIGELASKLTVEEWIKKYEAALGGRK